MAPIPGHAVAADDDLRHRLVNHILAVLIFY